MEYVPEEDHSAACLAKGGDFEGRAALRVQLEGSAPAEGEKEALVESAVTSVPPLKLPGGGLTTRPTVRRRLYGRSFRGNISIDSDSEESVDEDSSSDSDSSPEPDMSSNTQGTSAIAEEICACREMTDCSPCWVSVELLSTL